MKAVIGGVIGGIIVLFVIILFPTQIDTVQEIITQQTMHPCQRTTIDTFEIHKENANLRSLYGIGDKRFDEKIKELVIKQEYTYQIMIENNCENTQIEWLTEEFIIKMKLLLDEEF